MSLDLSAKVLLADSATDQHDVSKLKSKCSSSVCGRTCQGYQRALEVMLLIFRAESHEIIDLVMRSYGTLSFCLTCSFSGITSGEAGPQK